MDAVTLDHTATLWLINDTPARMVYAGHRWRITDTPTRIRDSVWATPLESNPGLYGWRFQATDGNRVLMFDVYRAEDGWHVHHVYD